jgi:aromatic ring-cleaving dioxygenase
MMTELAISDFHAHIYYDAAEVDRCARAGRGGA